MKNSLILFSGGLDSYLALLLAKEVSNPVAVFFDYGQNMLKEELNATNKLCGIHNVPVIVHKLDKQSLGIDFGVASSENNGDNSFITNGYVPNRNLLFATILVNIAYGKGITDLYFGFQSINDVDTSGVVVSGFERSVDLIDLKKFFSYYVIDPAPDQEPEFMQRMKDVIDSSSKTKFNLHTPLLYMSKADIQEKLNELGMLGVAIEHTRSCYATTQKEFYWGWGCDNCTTCKMRKLGYLKATS